MDNNPSQKGVIINEELFQFLKIFSATKKTNYGKFHNTRMGKGA